MESIYNRNFDRIEGLCKVRKRYTSRHNTVAQRMLGFKLSNEVAAEFFLIYSA